MQPANGRLLAILLLAIGASLAGVGVRAEAVGALDEAARIREAEARLAEEEAAAQRAREAEFWRAWEERDRAAREAGATGVKDETGQPRPEATAGERAAGEPRLREGEDRRNGGADTRRLREEESRRVLEDELRRAREETERLRLELAQERARNVQATGRDAPPVVDTAPKSGGDPRTPPPASAPIKTVVILDIGNDALPLNRPEKASKFEIAQAHVITLIRTMHWNGGRGAAPGSIGLRCRDGQSHGPWPATGEPGAQGVENVLWAVRPDLILPSTVCSILDSDPDTWSRNEATKHRGFARVEGYPVEAAAPSTAGAKPDGSADAGTPGGAAVKAGNPLDKLLDLFKKR